MERIDKILSHGLGWSRKEVKDAIKQKRVVLNNVIVKDSSIKVSDNDLIYVDEELVKTTFDEVIMIHKPKGVVCSTTDPHLPTVFDFFKLSSKIYHMIGRLDQDTTGLLLLTKDGQLTHQLMSPHKKVMKYYRVNLLKPITEEAINKLRIGVDIQDETLTAPAQVHQVSEHIIELGISEGRYHQIKRMMLALDNEVVELHRYRLGPLTLDSLNEGEWRALTQSEIESLKEKHI
ncbi:MAG: rRNA pseudouridine synthase [Erysipelothrix sp.]|jgi:16S rRNA pseudouridine516 synthase|nr:rRNA pseudouridine synthase [Erysipelothrix sp.]